MSENVAEAEKTLRNYLSASEGLITFPFLSLFRNL